MFRPLNILLESIYALKTEKAVNITGLFCFRTLRMTHREENPAHQMRTGFSFLALNNFLSFRDQIINDGWFRQG